VSGDPFLYDPERCPLTAALDVIGGKWRGLIWWRLENGLGRFGALHRSLPQISRKVLIEELQKLEQHGVVRREAFDETPPRVEYSLTEYGKSLGPVVDCLCGWGEQHLARDGAEGHR
jgi:DNA-binding HxlR family transcriptional regulator